MKNIITLALLLSLVSFSSCSKKKNVAPETTTTTTNTTDNTKINVQYRVSSSSGQIKVQYTTVEDGVIKTNEAEVNRYTFSYSFDWTTKQKLSVSAYNSNPSNKEVVVEIYVNGELFKSGKANAAGAVASAEGVYN
jgi:hypothetical protein